MSKAFARVEWSYLEAVMTQLGYATSRVELIMIVSLLSTSHSSLSARSKVKSSMVEASTNIISTFPHLLGGAFGVSSKDKTRWSLMWSPIRQQQPLVSHIFFADDNLIFFKVKPNEGRMVKGCLKVYARASGQIIKLR